eukprot:gene12099-25382_t
MKPAHAILGLITAGVILNFLPLFLRFSLQDDGEYPPQVKKLSSQQLYGAVVASIVASFPLVLDYALELIGNAEITSYDPFVPKREIFVALILLDIFIAIYILPQENYDVLSACTVSLSVLTTRIARAETAETKNIDEMMVSADTALCILNDMLTYDKLQTDPLRLQLQLVSPWPIISDTIASMFIQAREVDVDLSFISAEDIHETLDGYIHAGILDSFGRVTQNNDSPSLGNSHGHDVVAVTEFNMLRVKIIDHGIGISM